MRCKRHVTDLSSTVGVCASCLRDRLHSVIAAQSQQQRAARNQVHAQLLAAAASSLDQHNRKSDFDRRESDRLKEEHHQSERILFPRSVSPYVLRGRRKMYDDEVVEDVVVPDRRFYSTPQIGQRMSERRKHERQGGGGGRFSFFSGLFKTRSDRLEKPMEFNLNIPQETKASTSFSWFSSMRWKHKSKETRKTSANNANTTERLPRRVVVMDRGMTPERTSCDGFEDGRIEFVSDSCKRTPARGVKVSSNMSGMAFCLSPLVRASPARLWNQKSVPSDFIGFSGEIRSAGNPNLSTASSYCANRSRKLVDFGRASHHH